MEDSSKKSISKEDLVGKAGPVAGSALSILGALLVLIGFVMPWASCGGYKLTALDLVQGGIEGDFGNASSAFLCLVPFFALGILGVSLALIPASLIKKIPTTVKPVAALLLPLLVMLACCPSIIFFARMQSTRSADHSFGMGRMITIEYGYWITMIGLFVALVGGLIALGTAGGSYWLGRKKPLVEGDVPPLVESPPEDSPPAADSPDEKSAEEPSK
jgi:hypothetical protein